jgi:SAM-dependent methyltransferase
MVCGRENLEFDVEQLKPAGHPLMASAPAAQFSLLAIQGLYMKRIESNHFLAFMRPWLRNLRLELLGLIDRLSATNELMPPKSMIFVGGGDFKKIGEEFKEYFIELGGLRPEDHVLDVGSGIGRMAIPLTSYLATTGEYRGVDIVRPGIDWCRRRISRRYPNFVFLHSDIYNKLYNAGGRVAARDYRFPFEDGYFDFVFLTSVFTHMLRSDVENYLCQISRVLKPGGRVFMTFFLLNQDSEAFLVAGRSTQNFIFDLGDCKTVDESNPEAAIAYREDVMISLLEKAGLAIRQPIRYGSWSGRPEFLSYQDIVVATKP